MNSELAVATLIRLTVLFSAGALLLLLLRPLLLRYLGARAAYQAWLLLPLLLVGPWLPLPETGALTPVDLPVLLAAAINQALPAAQPAQAAAGSAALLWLTAWAAGALLLAAGQVALQRRYLQRLQFRGGRWRAPAGTSPAVVGVWPRQRLVLPLDFKQRFDATARRLVLAHEAVHARRHDNACNLLGAALLCLQWFNPLAWWAWRGLRNDQELACDAAVLATAPGAVTAYGRAMLAAHQGGLQPALASGWAARHPLVQRISLLGRHRAASHWQRLFSLLLVLGLGGGGALLARAAQAPPMGREGQAMRFELMSQLGGGNWTRSTLLLPGAANRPDSGPWNTGLTAMQQGWCLNLMLHVFGDGSLRPTGQVLDEKCQQPLSDWQALKLNGSVAQFVARTTAGPLQAQLSARWTDPKEPALPALMKAELETAPLLSPAQRQLAESRQAQMAERQRQMQSQDRAWRTSREAQPADR